MSSENIEMRKEFEEAAYMKYFMSSISFNPSKQFADCAAKPKDEWMARKDDGSYVEDSLNVAWWAWQEAKKKTAPFGYLWIMNDGTSRFIKEPVDDSAFYSEPGIGSYKEFHIVYK